MAGDTIAEGNSFPVLAVCATAGTVSPADTVGEALGTLGGVVGVGAASAALTVATGVGEEPDGLTLVAPGTFPVPGDPSPGKTVPSCKLPRSGWAAVGAEEATGGGYGVFELSSAEGL